LFAVAVKVAAVAVLTADAVAVNVALVAPAATVTDAGTVTSALLLASVTVSPPDGAPAVSVTAQPAVPAPVIDPLVQVSELSVPAALDGAAATPVPLRLTVEELPSPALLVTVTAPLALPVAVGLNAAVSFSDPPAATVAGKAGSFVIEKPLPAT
jgi:hypothetical protein